ncbi:LacI family DNA-binding transcriptional regulator [Ideonella sp. BN130291]|uniref:LacI family DNA-binding transcriptional regulator n=1 Tax=Ideonella sp. BN130291 TaxID=3112940 RepID=UPI002E269B6E|nr:LacI family DNA-binding transcriptional regulator [Ideonella sp. BN130291]
MPKDNNEGTGRRATMTDVAKRAGVSQSTVSLVLNGTPGMRLSEPTRQRVLKAAEALGYQLPGGRPHLALARRGAASAQAQVAPLIVYLADEISTSPHPVVSIDGAKDEAWTHGAVVAVFAARSNAEIESAVLATMLASPNLVGVIYSTVFTRQARVPQLLHQVPTVLLNCYEEPAGEAAAGSAPQRQRASATIAPPRLSSIVPAEVAGGHAATERLIEQGHRRIALINGEPWMDAAQDRLKGYRRALASHDIAFEPRLVRTGDWQVATGYEHTLSLMAEPLPPTAIFCANDLMAVGCLEALRSLGLAVPGDVSVIGYDDQEIAQHTHPPLTTLVLPNYEMGRLAVEVLLAERASPDARRRRLKVEGRIVERSTVGAPAVTAKVRKARPEKSRA